MYFNYFNHKKILEPLDPFLPHSALEDRGIHLTGMTGRQSSQSLSPLSHCSGTIRGAWFSIPWDQDQFWEGLSPPWLRTACSLQVKYDRWNMTGEIWQVKCMAVLSNLPAPTVCWQNHLGFSKTFEANSFLVTITQFFMNYLCSSVNYGIIKDTILLNIFVLKKWS